MKNKRPWVVFNEDYSWLNAPLLVSHPALSSKFSLVLSLFRPSRSICGLSIEAPLLFSALVAPKKKLGPNDGNRNHMPVQANPLTLTRGIISHTLFFSLRTPHTIHGPWMREKTTVGTEAKGTKASEIA